MVPVITFVGAAVDYTRANTARSSMQAAMDSASLMLAKDLQDGTITTAQITQKAQDYFKALYTNPDAKSVGVTATYTAAAGNGSRIEIAGNGKIDTSFMKLVGIPDINRIGSRDRALILAELRGLLDGIFQNIPDRDVCAGRGEPQRHGAANALRRAGHDDFRRQCHDDSPQTVGTAGLSRSSTPQSRITGSIASRPYACHISAASANTTLVPRSRSSMSMAGGASQPPPLM